MLWVAEPERSNRARHRLERPLDTMRSCGEAIEGSYSRRASSYTTTRPSEKIPLIRLTKTALTGFPDTPGATELMFGNSRRNSYYQGKAVSTSSTNAGGPLKQPLC